MNSRPNRQGMPLLLLVTLLFACWPLAAAAGQKGVERPRPDAARTDRSADRPGNSAPKADVWDRGAKTSAPAKSPADTARTTEAAKRGNAAKPDADAARRQDKAGADKDRPPRDKGPSKADVWDRGPQKPQPTMRAAHREAMRRENIPTSQQPREQKNTKAGRQYAYDVPKSEGGKETKYVQRNNGVDRSHPGQLHVEAGRPKVDQGKTRPDGIGRPRLTSDKTKVVVGKPNGK